MCRISKNQNDMKNLLKILHSLLIKGPLGVLFAILRLLFLLLLFIPYLLIRFWECLVKWLRKMNFKEEGKGEKDCNPPFPEPVMRRPDPCIYSQTYLAAQGLPVTWNNPDIWMAKAATPQIVEPDSYHLLGDTDYLVSVRAHNASTDLALGVKVRLLYRPWSFNSPDLLPVDTNVNNEEVVRFVNIAGMGSAIAQFNWRTPSVSPGQTRHFCLQAHLSHPMDINLGNNMGQENTNVHSANPGHVAPGELIQVDVPLFNHARIANRFFFHADAYNVNEKDTIVLKLQTNTGRRRQSLSQQVANLIPSLQPTENNGWRIAFGRLQQLTVTRARYVGHESYKKDLLRLNFALPEGMTFETPDKGEGLLLRPNEQRIVQVSLKVPLQATNGQQYSINVRASTETNRLIGGVTFLLTVKI